MTDFDIPDDTKLLRVRDALRYIREREICSLTKNEQYEIFDIIAGISRQPLLTARQIAKVCIDVGNEQKNRKTKTFGNYRFRLFDYDGNVIVKRNVWNAWKICFLEHDFINVYMEDDSGRSWREWVGNIPTDTDLMIMKMNMTPRMLGLLDI